MNDQRTLTHFRAAVETLRADIWQAWNLREHQSDAILLTPCETMEEAVNQALERGGWHPGDVLAVQHSHAGRRQHTLWQFKISRSSKRTWRRSYDGGPPVAVYETQPKLFSQTSLSAPFAPVLRFDAYRDDAVGVDRSMVSL